MFLEVNNINTYYGIFQAIFNVSLSLEKGEVVCLLGRNGAGKTTTLSSIVGLNPAEVREHSVQRCRAERETIVRNSPNGNWLRSGEPFDFQ